MIGLKIMSITEIQEQRRKLEQEIMRLIAEFNTATGVTVSSVNVEMVEVTACGDIGRRFTPAAITVDVGL